MSTISRIYRRIGIHASPPGTLFYYVDASLQRIGNMKLSPYISGRQWGRGAFGTANYYDIPRVRQQRPVGGLALVFFMGLGDYLMATPTIEALSLAHPDLPIYGYASSNTDEVNSSLVVHLMRANPLFAKVFTYRGRPGANWKAYNFRDALKDVPKDFLILPVVYDTHPDVFHRVASLMEIFGLPVATPIPPPLLPTVALSPAAAEILRDIRARAAEHATRGIACCHFGTRSSGYLYPHAEQVLTGLAKSGHLVLDLTNCKCAAANIVDIDVAAITPADTIQLLRELRQDGRPLHVLSVNSVMWPISAGLGLRNLGLHVIWDGAVPQYLYPNIFLVTQHFYKGVSPSRLFLAPAGTYDERPNRRRVMLTDYDPNFVLDAFEQMVAAI